MSFRMTSCPYTATSFTNEDERVAALAFAEDYKSANFMSMSPSVQHSGYGTDLVLLPSFAGDLWVTTS